MKNLILGVFALLMLSLTACNKTDNVQEQPTTVQNNNSRFLKPGATARSIWGAIKAFLGFSVSVDFSYKSGYWYATWYENGNIASEGCKAGDAVCEVIVHGGVQSPTNPMPNGFANGIMGINQQNEVVLVVPRTSLSQATYDDHYADGVATVPEDWVLQSELRDGLGLAQGFTIQAGDYTISTQIVDSEEYLVIVF